MADLTDLKLGETSVDEIIARLVADTTAGIDPASPAYPDVIFGSVLHDVFGAASLEFDRLYDRVHTELVAAVMPDRSFGEFLDAWAVTLGVSDGAGGYGRKGAVRATGAVLFTAGPDPDPVVIPAGATVSTESAAEDTDEQEFTTDVDVTLPGAGGFVVASITAVDEGVEGKVPANSIRVLISGVGNVASVTNPLPTTGGADIEDDPALQDRVVKKLRGGGGQGNVSDYENWALDEPGVGFVTVEREWAGLGSVRVTITDPDNDPASAAVVDSLQARLDPVDGSPGQAPIGAVVTVATPVSLPVTVTADVTPEGGYSLDGAGGTIALADTIEASLRKYVDRLAPGSDVIRAKVIAAIADVVGVANVAVSAPAGDVAVAALEVPALTTLNLT